MEDAKKKTGILTFHYTNNYGAVLQAYALQTALRSADPDQDVCVIDYRCRDAASLTTFRELWKAKGGKALLHYLPARRLDAGFYGFRKKYLKLSKSYHKTEELAEDMEEYRAVISGSDQVWNRNLTGRDPVYFQDFHREPHKKYSYAASLGSERLEEGEVSWYEERLKEFRGVSVREGSAARNVAGQLGIEVMRHIDPVFLLTADEWERLAVKPGMPEPYILVYLVPYQQNVLDEARKLGRRTGIRVVLLTKTLRPQPVKCIRGASPLEFVGWICQAEYVVTNSFHGTAFGLIFQKKMLPELRNVRGYNSRVRDLLDLCAIEAPDPGNERILDPGVCGWKRIGDILERERERSMHYLKQICGGMEG